MAETFENHLKSLEEAVGKLESGEEPLARSLEIYEEAVKNLRACHTLLGDAELKVRKLVRDRGGDLVEELLETADDLEEG